MPAGMVLKSVETQMPSIFLPLVAIQSLELKHKNSGCQKATNLPHFNKIFQPVLRFDSERRNF
jgi:hypothetical protein